MTADDQVRLRAQLKADEGCVLYAYKDSLGFTSIGFGRMIDHSKGGGISESEAEFLLGNDIANVEAELAPFAWFAVQDSVRQAALANFCFNVGLGGLLHFPQFLLHMANKDYAGAVSELIGTPWQSETGVRADRIIQLIQTGAWP